MRIELASLEGGKGAFAHSYAPDELVLEDDRVRLLKAPTVSGKIRQQGARVHLSGQVTALAQVECDRCLKLVELPIDSHFNLEYVTAEDYRAQQAIELTEEDLDLSVFDGDAIDIDGLVKEELLLAVPDHVLCDESCKGMCPVCGVDRNSVDCECETQEIDPRWAGLKKLMTSK
ncbi:MAG: YceD family protein [Pyrinomonadaceae bacterium]